MIPQDVAQYGSDVASRVERVVGVARVVGAYFVGSVALRDYVPTRSDIDIIAVIDRKLPDDEKREVVDALRHPNLPCPARGLEFVLYTREAVGSPEAGPGFEINLNTGRGMETHIGFDALAEPRFWFLIDRAIAHQSGIAIVGLPPTEVFAPIPRRLVLEAMAESIAWHRANEKLSGSTVLNACRSWRYADAGILGSKSDAAEWARPRSSDPNTIDAALEQRRGGAAELDEPAIAALLGRAQVAITAARCRVME